MSRCPCVRWRRTGREARGHRLSLATPSRKMTSTSDDTSPLYRLHAGRTIRSRSRLSVSVEDSHGVACTMPLDRPSTATSGSTPTWRPWLLSDVSHPSLRLEDPTKATWDWSKAATPREEDPHHYLKIQGEFTYEQGALPRIRWFTARGSLPLGDSDRPDQVTRSTARGASTTPRSHLALQSTGPSSPTTRKKRTSSRLVTGGLRLLLDTFDWQDHLPARRAASHLPYSVATASPPPICTGRSCTWWPEGAGVRCNRLPRRGQRLYWKALGYQGDPLTTEAAVTRGYVTNPGCCARRVDRWATRQPIHPVFAPLDATGHKVTRAERSPQTPPAAAATTTTSPRTAARGLLEPGHLRAVSSLGGELEVRADRLDAEAGSPRGHSHRHAARANWPPATVIVGAEGPSSSPPRWRARPRSRRGFSLTVGEGAVVSPQRMADSFVDLAGKAVAQRTWDVHAASWSTASPAIRCQQTRRASTPSTPP